MEKYGFPKRKKLPGNVQHEANLLQANRWPRCADEGKGDAKATPRLKKGNSLWNRVPMVVGEGSKARNLSKEARLVGDLIYDVSLDGLSLYCFHIVASEKKRLEEKLSEPCELSFDHPVVSYDVDFDAAILAVLGKGSEGLYLSIHRYSQSSFDTLKSVLIDTKTDYEFKEVQVNRSSVLLSLDNFLQVFDWKIEMASDSILALHRQWSRNSNGTRLGGWYVRATLLSPQVVACIVLSTYRTIGSMRVRHGVIELYRLDQFVPRVADILLPEAFVDALQPRILQAACKYVFFDVGGKSALNDCLEKGYDGPVIIQIFSETVSVDLSEHNKERRERGKKRFNLSYQHSTTTSEWGNCQCYAICCTPELPWLCTRSIPQNQAIQSWEMNG